MGEIFRCSGPMDRGRQYACVSNITFSNVYFVTGKNSKRCPFSAFFRENSTLKVSEKV